MKRQLTVWMSALALGLIAGATPALANGGRFDKIDANHDGVIDRSEWTSAREMFEQKKEKADTNNDGVVDEAEKAAAKTIRKEHFKEKADLNHDGTVDGLEKKEALEHRKPYVDKDNNPPGPEGGKGTNWENPTGPKGGPGASPDRR